MFASLRDKIKWRLAPERPRQLLVAAGTLLFGLIIGVNLFLLSDNGTHNRVVPILHSSPPIPPPDQSPPVGYEAKVDQQHRAVHVVLPATQSNANLCKLLLTHAMNGWPRPHLAAWGLEFNDTRMLGDGSHLAKITGVLDWLNNESDRRRNVSSTSAEMFENELVTMLDAYDIWVQLPLEVLISRYYATLEAEDRRIAQRMGRAADIEDIRAKVVFAATKRCGPNQWQSIACFPIPESPLPRDLFGPGTDTDSGENQFAHVRQRWLVSGFAIGTVRDMRAVFQEAHRRMQLCLTQPPSGDRPSWTRLCHHGSDQSLFNEVLGHQEFQREVMRRHHRTKKERLLDQRPPRPLSTPLPGSPSPQSTIQGHAIDDPLNPSFPHEELDEAYLPGKPYEYGITVDYFSELTHQTSNSLWDAAYVEHSDPHTATIMPILPDTPTNCTVRTPKPVDFNLDSVPGTLDTAGSGQSRWKGMPLYTELCTGNVPVLIHHNDASFKWMRDKLWPKSWWAGKARALLDLRKDQDGPLAGGAHTDTGLDLSWDDLCPAKYNSELFGHWWA